MKEQRRIKARVIPIVRKARRIDRARGKMSPDDILALQKSKLKALVKHAIEHSPMYRELYRGIDPDNFDLSELPPISKSDIMSRFDDSLCVRDLTLEEVEEFVSDLSRVGELYKGKYVISHTSGTTGKPGIFVIDEAGWLEGAALAAAKIGRLNLKWSTILSLPFRPLYRFRFAAIIATRGHLASYIAYLAAPGVRRLFVKMMVIDVLSPFDEIVEKLERFKPNFIHAYPTFLRRIAQMKIDGQLKLDPILINVASEYFDPATEALCQKAFPKTIIGEVYGTTECVPMARRCGDGRLHVISEACIIEPVDENDNPVGFGEPSHHILLTNLFNYTQPLIRYRVSDSVTVWQPDKCTCGSPLPVIEVIGRANDVLKLPKKGGGVVSIFPVQLYLGAYGIEEIEQFQVIHEKPELVEVKLSCKQGHDAAKLIAQVESKLTEILSSLGADVVVKAELAEVERDPQTGKFRQFIERANMDAKQTGGE
ncbi:MAG TPA: phenylacetate--CoA ligase family protein [Proteobacteria bacterium]|nr:phenylacetate--CoA ligase family protein [Pseudomonadota bacterium]